ncbi:SGNH/GDSL hydrolase family protein [Ruminococcus sp.]|uniref:SGNH/GDSL hydrolase family protein n=1 Tax=Ruminococcus sp. TaxID=41978 RepID=UPI003891105C
MRIFQQKRIWIIALLLLASILITLLSVVVVDATERAAKKIPPAGSTAQKTSDGERLQKQLDQALLNRSRWLYDLMKLSGKAQPEDSANPQRIYEQACACGIIDKNETQDMYLPLERRFVAKTMVKALGYKRRSPGYLADVVAADSDMETMAYYGYFLPDGNAMIHPESKLTAQEYDALIDALTLYQSLKGKTLLTFGDSIMYGSGNQGEGIADMFGDKYGMTVHDYSVPGSTMGIREDRGHIRDQVLRAAIERIHPDLILINGGTNDMYNLPLGVLSTGFEKAMASESDFTEGMEKTLWSIRQNWRKTPVVYLRMHNMNFGSDTKERQFGERAMAVAEKWSIRTVDVFNDSEMNAEDAATCNRYTYLKTSEGYVCDSVHPNALGYAKFYLPLLSEAVTSEFK